MHRVIAGISPSVTVIDITHQVPPHDVRSGALALWRAAPWLAPGVILAVVDPGVGTDRGAVAIAVDEAEATLIGPDNGLLVPAARRLGPITRAFDIVHHPTGRGATFAGREIFGPAAGRVACGTDPGDLGPPRAPETLQPAPIPTMPDIPGGPGPNPMEAEVLWVDRFGNAQLNVSADDATWRHDAVEVEFERARLTVRWAHTYADLDPGEVGLVHDSYDLLSLCLYEESAADRLGLRPGDRVRLAHG